MTLDPVTFEVLKNGFVTTVDLMAEQILRTCHSFVIYSRDFSSALCDREGNTVAQGNQDLAAHVGTLHFTAKAVIDAFAGDMRPGDVFAINDPYLGGTHHSDVRVVRPIFHEGEAIAYAQSNGHWIDVGGSVPGSFDVTQREHFGLGLRIPPVRVWDAGRLREDVVRLMVSNMRAPAICEGDLHAQAEATRVAEQELLRYVGKYGVDTVLAAFEEVQDYVERLTRQRLAELPDGTWESEDYLDFDPDLEEGLVPIKVKMTIAGDQVHYDLTGSHPVIGSMSNAAFGSSFSAVVGATKMFFSDLPLNSGFYRAVTFDAGPEGTVVNAPWPVAVSAMVMPYEKIADAIIDIWSHLVPERAMACAFQIEYLQVGGRDRRWPDGPFFMLYDWLSGGWGGRNGKDGANATSAVFGPGLNVQSVEAQERLSPVVTTRYEIFPDSGGPGRFRGGCGVRKGARLTDARSTVVSYICDRERSIVWGIDGGLPSYPHGLWLEREGADPWFLGATCSNVPLREGDVFWRPSAGGGGFGDPLERDPVAVREDVADGYVTIERAAKDYGVVVRCVDADLAEYEVDEDATARERERIRAERLGWLEEDPDQVAGRYRAGELDAFDLVRHYGVIVHWGTGELYPRTTATYRAMLRRRSASYWQPAELPVA